MNESKALHFAELNQLLDENNGWLVLHIGTPLHSEHDPSAKSFDEAAERLALHWSAAKLQRCELSPAEAARCPIVRSASPSIVVFRGSKRVDRISGGVTADDLVAFLEFTVSYHTTWAPAR